VSIPLEDNYLDILGKAQRGLGLTSVSLPKRADDEAALRKLAATLELDPDALMMVNSYLVFDPKTKRAAAFDTGTDCDGMLQLVAKSGMTIGLILLTHSHGDHILDLDRLKAKTKARAFSCELESVGDTDTFAPGRQFEIGNLKVETRLTNGHSRGGVTYVVSGMSRRLAIVGDAMFAGSMGGGMVSYEDALRTNREQILTLPDDTVICPGHGPLTTVGEEKQHNPFFALRV
jgi:hydroxyacylglutathione hydrolase